MVSSGMHLFGQAAGALHAAPAQTLVVQNYYYALPGRAQEVFEWRLHASAVRAKLGLRRGRVLRRLKGDGTEDASAPDVIWECEYPSAAARDADVAQLSEHREFSQVEQHMGTLLRKFGREVFELRA